MTTYTMQCITANYDDCIVTVEAESVDEACEKAIEEANGSDGWRHLDAHNGTFIEQIAEGVDLWDENGVNLAEVPTPYGYTERAYWSDVPPDDYRDCIEAGISVAQRIVDNWSRGDLAGAVRSLEDWATKAADLLPDTAAQDEEKTTTQNGDAGHYFLPVSLRVSQNHAATHTDALLLMQRRLARAGYVLNFDGSYRFDGDQ